ncbi:MAG: hypothetical protein LW709_06705 [Oxalobacteraceae bacterium]|jgi:hypothetical protein|nr:hypothetical protein [Oxalobacteraceae bacterium]MCE2831745.1 hypothetical protein [Oxalobacteraceae bacterium]
MALSSTGLKNIHEKIQPMMETNETLLRTELGTINDGSEITTAQLLRLQYLIARYTVTATTFANIIKEMSDSLKGVASKIG